MEVCALLAANKAHATRKQDRAVGSCSDFGNVEFAVEHLVRRIGVAIGNNNVAVEGPGCSAKGIVGRGQTVGGPDIDRVSFGSLRHQVLAVAE